MWGKNIWKNRISWAILGLVSLAGAAGGQVAGVGIPIGKEIPPTGAFGSLEPSPASAPDSQDPSVVWGHREEPSLTCLPGARAYVAKLGVDGRELWRRDASLDPQGLLAGLSSLDPRHILASTIHGVTADPFTGQLYAVVEALVAWQGGGCKPGLSTALGTLVLGLTPDGTPVRDVYLGTWPDGPPPAAFECHELCAVDRRPQIVGRGISVGNDGEVVVAGRRRVTGRDEIFATRFGSDLSPRQGGSLSLLFSEEGSFSKMIPKDPRNSVCPPATDPTRNLLDVQPIGNPTCPACFNKEDLYASSEGCRMRIEVNKGIETIFAVSPGTSQLDIRLKFTCTDTVVGCGVRLVMKNNLDDWQLIAVKLDNGGVIDTRGNPVSVPTPTDYIDANDRVHLRLIVGVGSADSDGDLDELDMVDS